MRHDDKDMIVMYNKFLYDDAFGNKQEHVSSLVCKGKYKITNIYSQI